jgi:hypothetical protein
MGHSWLESRACLAESKSTHGLGGVPGNGLSWVFLSSPVFVLESQTKFQSADFEFTLTVWLKALKQDKSFRQILRQAVPKMCTSLHFPDSFNDKAESTRHKTPTMRRKQSKLSNGMSYVAQAERKNDPVLGYGRCWEFAVEETNCTRLLGCAMSYRMDTRFPIGRAVYHLVKYIRLSNCAVQCKSQW